MTKQEKADRLNLFNSIAVSSLVLLREKLRQEILAGGYDVKLLDIIDKSIDISIKESEIIFTKVVNQNRRFSDIK